MTPTVTRRRTSGPRVLLVAALSAAGLCAVSIVTVDGPLALRLSRLSPEIVGRIQAAVSVVEVAFAFPISPYLYSGLLVLGGHPAGADSFRSHPALRRGRNESISHFISRAD